MDEPPREPVKVWQFLRQHFVRIVIGTVLLVASCGVVSVYATYQRKQRMTREIEAHGGDVAIEYAGPTWIPQSVQDRMPYLDRIRHVSQGATAPSVLLTELRSLHSLQGLDLSNTQVTDAGLEHLKGMTKLSQLDIRKTQVTAEGRAMLQKALPDCFVESIP